VSAVNLGLRVLMETGLVAGLAYWGARTGDTTAAKLLLGIGAPLVGFGIWGALDFRNVGSHAEAMRLTQELVLSALAAVALYTVGQHLLGLLLAAVSIAHHLLVYAIGERLLKAPAEPRARRDAWTGAASR
jgi:hypothetical protein